VHGPAARDRLVHIRAAGSRHERLRGYDAAVLELYAFSYFDERRGRWVRARYRATLEEIAARYARYRIAGAPEIRHGSGATAGHLARGPSAR